MLKDENIEKMKLRTRVDFFKRAFPVELMQLASQSSKMSIKGDETGV